MKTSKNLSSWLSQAVFPVLISIALCGVRFGLAADPVGSLVQSGADGGKGVPASIDVAVAQLSATPVNFAPLPHLDKGPAEMVPTELFLKRSMSANLLALQTHAPVYSQEVSLYVPIYYDGAFLSLSSDDKTELRSLTKEFNELMKEHEAWTSRFADFLDRYGRLHERGRPKGIIDVGQLLAPYDPEHDRLGGLEPLRVVRDKADAQIDLRPGTDVGGPVPVSPVK